MKHHEFTEPERPAHDVRCVVCDASLKKITRPIKQSQPLEYDSFSTKHTLKDRAEDRKVSLSFSLTHMYTVQLLCARPQNQS